MHYHYGNRSQKTIPIMVLGTWLQNSSIHGPSWIIFSPKGPRTLRVRYHGALYGSVDAEPTRSDVVALCGSATKGLGFKVFRL